MKRTITALVLDVALALPVSGRRSKECDRVENAGRVTKEIMDIPDDIPQNVIDKADCVVVLPSVVKAAFVVGASYGRGVMTCRGGTDFRGPWGAPTNDGAGRRKFRFPGRRAGHRFRAAADERTRGQRNSGQQSETGWRRFRGGRPRRAQCLCRNRCDHPR